MLNDNFDLRWFLLNNLVKIPHPQRFYSFFLVIFSLIFIYLALFPIFSGKIPKIKQFLGSDLIFTVSIVVFIIVARWPAFLASFLNPDEVLFIAGAMKFLQDPVPWRSLDGTTSGPLNFYVATLPSFFGFKLEYASVRVVGLILMTMALICLYYALQLIYNQRVARLTMIPVVTTVALMKYKNYVHYTSEHLPITLSSIALLILVIYYAKDLMPNHQNSLIFSLGFVLGLIPYAKLQGIPIAVAIAIIFVHILWLKHQSKPQFFKSLSLFILSGLLFSVIIIIVLTVFSLYDHFWKSYLQINLSYYVNNWSAANTWRDKMIIFQTMTNKAIDTKVFFIFTRYILIFGLPVLIFQRLFGKSKQGQSQTFVFVYYSLVLLAASVYAVIRPGNSFHHYLLFLIIPSGLIIGVILGELEQAFFIQNSKHLNFKSFLITVFIATIVASNSLKIYKSIKIGNPFIIRSKAYFQNYISPISKTILKYASAGESMAVWGWKSELYIETGIVQATRDVHSVWQITSHPLQAYYLQRYANDLLNASPHLFVDAVAPKMFKFQNRETEGHEAFPEIAKIIKEHYQLVEEVEEVRIYKKNNNLLK